MNGDLPHLFIHCMTIFIISVPIIIIDLDLEMPKFHWGWARHKALPSEHSRPAGPSHEHTDPEVMWPATGHPEISVLQ